MIILSRIAPFLAVWFDFFLLYEIIDKPKYFYKLSVLMFLAIIIAVFLLSKFKVKERTFWLHLILPISYLAGIILFILFIEIYWLKIVLSFILFFLLWLYLENIYVYHFNKEKYQEYSMENFSTYLNLIIMFLISSSFFGFLIYKQTALWQLLISLIILVVACFYQTLWLYGIKLKISWPYLLVIILIIAEGFWVIAFLPNSMYVKGMAISVIYYLLTGFTINKLHGILEKRVIKRYLLIAAVVLLIIFFTAKWI